MSLTNVDSILLIVILQLLVCLEIVSALFKKKILWRVIAAVKYLLCNILRQNDGVLILTFV